MDIALQMEELVDLEVGVLDQLVQVLVGVLIKHHLLVELVMGILVVLMAVRVLKEVVEVVQAVQELDLMEVLEERVVYQVLVFIMLVEVQVGEEVGV